MPEGFSSIADLKVIVDANADKFHSGIKGVMEAVDGLGQKGDASLGGLEKVIGLVGNAALTGSGKVKALMATVEAGVGLYQRFAEEGRAVAEVLGVTEEYDRLKASLDDLGVTIQDAAVGAFFALKSAGMDAATSVFGFASATQHAEATSESFAAKLIDRVTSVFDRIRLDLRLLTADTVSNARDIDVTLGLLEKRIDEARKSIAAMERGEAPRKGGFGQDLLAVTQEWLNKALEQRAALLERRSQLPGQDWIDGTRTIVSLLGEEIQQLERRNATLGMSAAAAAEYNAIQNKIAEALRNGQPLTDEQMNMLRAEAAIIGQLTQQHEDYLEAKRRIDQAAQEEEARARQRERADAQIAAGIEREIAALNARARALTMNADEAARLSKEEQLLNAHRAAGIPITEEVLAKVRAAADAYADASEHVRELESTMRSFQETSLTIARSVENAFRQWMQGAAMDGKALVASLLQDLAMLAMRKNVLEPLSDGLNAAFGSALSGLFGGGDVGLGSWTPTVFGGFRANGGPVTAGVSYVVGERGPEVFIPQVNGQIVPNGSTPITITTNIDARGATEGTVVELRRMLAERDAMLPEQIMRVMHESRSRSLA